MFAIHATPQMESFSTNDTQSLKSIQRRKLLVLAGKYSLFFVLLVLVFYSIPSGSIRIRDVKPEDISLALTLFAVFFALSLIGFMVNDYVAGMRPFQKELQQAQKTCYHFTARKYFDPIYKHYLLFYPDKEDVYINIDKECFDKIEEDEELYMEVTPVTGYILLLRSDRFQVERASEYRFR
jgi:hypothetical protein